MAAVKRYPPEIEERAVRLVLDARKQGNARSACARIAQQLGVKEDTLRGWVYQVEVDGGRKPGVTTDDLARLVELEKEVRELLISSSPAETKPLPLSLQ
ncbi:MAG: transposase [Microbacteriaceae bacterium]|nr:transposase [Microbacteriaceae bacterium]